MRALWTLAGLLVALALVAWLSRTQLVAPTVPAVPDAVTGTPANRSPRQVEDDVRRALDAAAQQQRAAMPEEAR